MSPFTAVLKEGHRHNIQRSVDARISDVNQQPSLGPSIQDPMSLKKGSPYIDTFTPISMDNAVVGCHSQKTSATDLNSYLSSPVRTLCESLNDPEHLYVSNHDIVEAYNVLCLRIRSRKDDISRLKKAEPRLLSILEENSHSIEQCISRDIRRVLFTPVDSQRHYSNGSFIFSYESDFPEVVLPDVLENMLCQYAIRLLSDLFMFPALYSNFSHGQLSSLFEDAVSLCTSRAAHIYDIERLCSMVLLMLRTQQLPLAVLQSEVVVLVDALDYAITHEQGIPVGKVDAFHAIHSILRRYPLLLRHFTTLLDPILNQLSVATLDIRLGAAFALSTFSILKLASTTAFPHDEVSKAVHTYVQEERWKPQSHQCSSLPNIVKSALPSNSSDREFWKKKGPGFALSLASTLLVLLDYHIFVTPPAIKFVFSVITESAGRRWSHNNGHREIWKALLWAFSRLPRHGNDFLEDEDDSKARMKSWKDIREKAFRVVKQELKSGLGIALVGALLDGEREIGDVEKAVEVLEEMVVQRENEGTQHVIVVLLRRLLSGIGCQSQEDTECKTYTVEFAKGLVDGSLIGKTFRDLILQPAPEMSLENIPPLSEAEASALWDRLTALWVSVVQDHLVRTNQDIPMNIIEIWQALLLVQGQLTESHQHLTGSHSFASRMASIMTNLSVPLVTPEAQASYLSTMSKLWAVVKNVFTKPWLSSPAERVLASLLKKRFDLSDGAVKNHWSRICADLVAVGVPTLLHVLHTRTLSPSQEEKEVTRHLWSILAGNEGQLRDDDDDDDNVREGDWIELVHLLALPFGAWDLDGSEIQTWETTFSRAIMLGSRVLKPSYEVISVILDILGDSKLPCLKDEPKVLLYLLSQLISAPFTTTSRRLLAVVDDFLGSLYSRDIEGDVTDGLELLHLIGSLFAQASGSDLVELIMVMPGLCKWIADEDTILTQDEHRDLVIAIYSTALEKLSFVEPSLDRLHSLAKFLQSGFVRIHVNALLSFQKFWRATYHQRKDIPSENYPVAIKASLKAWADVCDDSLADDVSLTSESQNLESHSIPDSQPSPGKSHEDGNVSASQGVNFHSGTAFIVNDDKLGSTSSTPKARKMTLPPSPDAIPPEVTTAIPPMQSQQRASRSTSPGHFFAVNSLVGSTHSNSPLKRSKESEGKSAGSHLYRTSRSFGKTLLEHHHQTPKRRRIQSDFLSRLLRMEPDSHLFSPARRQATVSEPVTRAASAISLLPPFSISQPSEKKRRPPKRQRDETPSWLGSDLKRLRKDVEADEESGHDGEASPDDYDSWERGMLTGLQEDGEEENPVGRQVEDNEMRDRASEDILSPSLGKFPTRSRRRDRSQTAPVPPTLLPPENESVSIPRAGNAIHHPRRHQSSPIERIDRQASSAQLDALQRAYAIITDTGTSQVDVRDIMHARRLANQINQVLDEQMCMKFGAHPPDGPDPT